MDEGNAYDISDSHMTNNFTFTTDYLSQFIHKKNKVHFRYISVEGQGYGVQGYRGVILGSGSRVRVSVNGRSRRPKPGHNNHPTMYDINYSPRWWSLLNWGYKQKVFKLRKYKIQYEWKIAQVATATLEACKKMQDPDTQDDLVKQLNWELYWKYYYRK